MDAHGKQAADFFLGVMVPATGLPINFATAEIPLTSPPD